MDWIEEPALEHGPGGCSCQTKFRTLDLDNVVAVGFGNAYVMRGKFCFYQENTPHWNPSNPSPLENEFDVNDTGADPTAGDIEKFAAADHDHDWRIYYVAPLYEATYQRHRDGAWYCIATGEVSTTN